MIMRLGAGARHRGSMHDTPDSSPMPHFRTLVFDDILADCIRLACKIDVNGHAVEGNVIDGNRMQLLMSFFAPNGILEIHVLQKKSEAHRILKTAQRTMRCGVPALPECVWERYATWALACSRPGSPFTFSCMPRTSTSLGGATCDLPWRKQQFIANKNS